MLGEVHATLKYLGPNFACSRRMKKPSACIGPARTKLTDMSKAQVLEVLEDHCVAEVFRHKVCSVDLSWYFD